MLTKPPDPGNKATAHVAKLGAANTIVLAVSNSGTDILMASAQPENELLSPPATCLHTSNSLADPSKGLLPSPRGIGPPVQSPSLEPPVGTNGPIKS